MYVFLILFLCLIYAYIYLRYWLFISPYNQNLTYHQTNPNITLNQLKASQFHSSALSLQSNSTLLLLTHVKNISSFFNQYCNTIRYQCYEKKPEKYNWTVISLKTNTQPVTLEISYDQNQKLTNIILREKMILLIPSTLTNWKTNVSVNKAYIVDKYKHLFFAY